jgi:hypothetical protein
MEERNEDYFREMNVVGANSIITDDNEDPSGSAYVI